MKRQAVILFLIFTGITTLLATNRDATITVHLRGVYDSKISLLALTKQFTFKPISEVTADGNNRTATITVPAIALPGEFVLRFDYRQKQTDTPYPSEKHIFLAAQNLDINVQPLYCNNPDSTWFQPQEEENAAFDKFAIESAKRKDQIGLLRNFLISYDDPGSDFYQKGIDEYEKRREQYNQWLQQQSRADSRLFVSHLYQFQYQQAVDWKGSDRDRLLSLISHYFDGMNLDDTLILKTSDINKWMDNYVNLYGQLSTTVALRDSLLPLAGKTAIDKASKGNPLVYGWMVDYFYRGYESNNIPAGMKILEPYLNDPKCLTSKRQEINRRLEGIKTLVPGVIAPDITLDDPGKGTFNLYSYKCDSPYLLLLFWSADCSHCKEMITQLYPWQQEASVRNKVQVIAISLDETDTEIKAWNLKAAELTGWKHLRTPDGIRSKIASDYFILATPVMILLDPKTKKILALPDKLHDLKPLIR